MRDEDVFVCFIIKSCNGRECADVFGTQVLQSPAPGDVNDGLMVICFLRGFFWGCGGLILAGAFDHDKGL